MDKGTLTCYCWRGNIWWRRSAADGLSQVFEHLFSSLFFSEAALACLAVDPAVMLMVVGFLMFIITFCGCVGSLRENICLLQTVIHDYFLFFLLQCTL